MFNSAVGMAIGSILMTALVGLAVKFYLEKKQSIYEITWKEYGLAMLVITLVVVPATFVVGWKTSKLSLVTYYEYWNGWELAVSRDETQCTRDGSCRYEYDCDPYIVPVSYSCNCDDKGNCQTCWRNETRYHECPYVDVETDYFVKTTLGDYTIDENRLPLNPQQHRWRKSESVPASIIERAGVGEHPFWTAAKSRVDSGSPGPVTKKMQYDNYILASDASILKQYSEDMEYYKRKGLLPNVASGVRDFYLADKAHFVGFGPAEPQKWQSAVNYLNAALGSELQGDLQLVVVQNPDISQNPDRYTMALKAHWQNKEVFEKNCLSKNGIVVIVGTTDGKTVAWARAFTGMPLGNEQMSVSVRNDLKGVALTLESVVGSITGKFVSGTKVKGVHGGGLVEQILWGIKSPDTKFARVSMKGGQPDDKGRGYLYLYGEIEPTKKQKVWIFVTAFFLSSFAWLITALMGERLGRRRW